MSASVRSVIAFVLALSSSGCFVMQREHEAVAAKAAEAEQQAAAARTPAALVFEAGDPARPLIVGFVQAPGGGREARIDGKRVVLTGEEEVELRCGEASISLKKNGKLIIRGAYVETRAKGTNRIKGGSVQIN